MKWRVRDEIHGQLTSVFSEFFSTTPRPIHGVAVAILDVPRCDFHRGEWIGWGGGRVGCGSERGNPAAICDVDHVECRGIASALFALWSHHQSLDLRVSFYCGLCDSTSLSRARWIFVRWHGWAKFSWSILAPSIDWLIDLACFLCYPINQSTKQSSNANATLE